MWDHRDAAFLLGFARVRQRVSVFLKQVFLEHLNRPFLTL
jgi:hypothetical protein